MNAAHVHLLVNHFPIIIPIVGAMVLIMGLALKSDAVKRTAYVAFIVGSLTAVSAMASGGGAEDLVEGISGVSSDFIERHEELAELFSILVYILGGLSLFGLWANIKQLSISKLSAIVVLFFAFVVIYFGINTGASGGEIRHTEIRDDYKNPISNNQRGTEDGD